MAPTQVFSCGYWGILKKTYFEEHLRTTASIRKGRRGKRAKTRGGEIFQMKEENENTSFNLYLQVLVLVKAETE